MCELVSAATMASITGIETATAFTVIDAVSIISTISSVGSSFSSAQAQKDQMAYQAGVDRNKAVIRERQAVDVTKRGEEDARAKKAQIASISDRQLVTLAGQGGDVTTGTSVDLLAETKERGKLEEKKIINNAARKATAVRADATNATADAVAGQLASDSINPLVLAGGTALKGFGQVGAQWYKRSIG
jgi:hypothetical protein